jgi:hypothetical protein
MKVWVVAGLAVLVAALAVAGAVYAQTPEPPFGPGYGYGMGGMMRGGGMMGGRGMMPGWTGDYGPMHDAMFDALAEALGLTRAELDSRVAAGETPHQIAAAEGLSPDEFAALMTSAREAAIEQAVADGLFTREQADWMLSHMGGRGFRNSPGGCPFHGGAAVPTGQGA